jgi:hypothetical protein
MAQQIELFTIDVLPDRFREHIARALKSKKGFAESSPMA